LFSHYIIVIQPAQNRPSSKAHCPRTAIQAPNQLVKLSSIAILNLKTVCPSGVVFVYIVFLDENNTIKLGDFGLSRTLSSHEIAFAQTYVGTPYYMSPEIISSLPYTHASDIWALGCVLYELMTHSPPFTAKTQMGLFQKIKEGVIMPLPRDRKTGSRLYSSEIEEVVRYLGSTYPLIAGHV
jgi:hypothetical protein